MKLVLATNQTERFVQFYESMRAQSGSGPDYGTYHNLLFVFDTAAMEKIQVLDTKSGRSLQEYDGVYLNGYLNAYELAVTVAICCDYYKIPFVDTELRGAPSLSKISAYAKLAVADVSIPRTFAGSKSALVAGAGQIDSGLFPAVLKRADADRGLDNYKVGSIEEAWQLLADFDDRTVWILQEFIENDGFYRVVCYGYEPELAIFRSMGERADRNPQKAHMFKPKGGANASLVPISDVPASVIRGSSSASRALKREISGVDILYDRSNDKSYVLEANYNPQLVTVDTFKEERIQAFLDYFKSDW